MADVPQFSSDLDEPDEDSRSPFPIVGIGASAGGFDAFTRLLENLPSETGMAFLFVQHLDPTVERQLTHLLAKSTSMPVVEASDGLRVHPNHVYVIPPSARMAVKDGALLLTPRADRGPHMPIDHLFS